MRPLILDYKITRSEESSVVPFFYDPRTSLNMISIEGLEIPFIDSDTSAVDLMTKTKQHRENDDDRFRFELATKTEVNRERDEPSGSLLELMTKTLKSRESDDTRFAYNQ